MRYILRMLFATGTKLGPYEILSPLGTGGMGEVYRARDPRLGREVALKVLAERLVSQPDHLARFEREARTAATLNHPNIVVLHSIEESDGVRFLTMELVEGTSLDHLVTATGLPISRVLDLGIPLADALAAAHGRGVIHRDLKPANVMVTHEGRVKVLDFGLAKLAVDAAAPASDATQAATLSPISSAGQAIGTIPYMSPEQLRGRDVDARTDLFSLGIILYELVTGRRPFAGATSAEISSAILRDAPAPLSNVRADLPPDLDRVISRCLEKDPDRRIQTAKDVRNELELLRRKVDSVATSSPWPSSAPAASGAPSSPSSTPSQPSGIPSAASPADVPSIAVLPFVNRSKNEDDEYFADGLADELLNVLAKIRGLRVAARTSSFQFKGKGEDLAAIGRKLNVATLLEGSLRKAGNRVRISVQLVKVSDGFHLWSETYDRTLDDIFAVQDDIAQSVVKELRTTLLGAEPDSGTSGEVKAEVARAAKGRGTDAEAHRLFLQGRYLVNRLSREDMTSGIEHLHRVIEMEPDHALAWAILSWAYVFQAGLGFAPVVEGNERAKEAALRAIALEPQLAEAHFALGNLQLWYDWDWDSAEKSLRRAIELSPGNAEALRTMGQLASVRGRLDEALSFGERALTQDPLDVSSHKFIARGYRCAGRLVEAERAARRALELSPQGVGNRLMLAWVLDELGRSDEALAMALQETADWSRLTGLAIIHQTAGRTEESLRALNELKAVRSVTAAFQIAEVHAHRGEIDEAFEWLERAYVQRDSGMGLLKLDIPLRRLHGDPRWTALLEKMGLAD